MTKCLWPTEKKVYYLGVKETVGFLDQIYFQKTMETSLPSAHQGLYLWATYPSSRKAREKQLLVQVLRGYHSREHFLNLLRGTFSQPRNNWEKQSKGLRAGTETPLLSSKSKANVRIRCKMECKYLSQLGDKVKENRKMREVKSVDHLLLMLSQSR